MTKSNTTEILMVITSNQLWTTYGTTPSNPLLISAILCSIFTLLKIKMSLYNNPKYFNKKVKKLASLSMINNRK